MIRVAILALTFAAVGVVAGGSVAAAPGPLADAGLDQTVTVETTVHLDGTGSGHPDGSLSGYEWTIRTPDGREVQPDCPDCERSQFTPSVVGRYEVTLTVTGPNGATSTDTLYVFVEDAGPEVELSGDRTPDPDEPVTYTAAARSPDAELEEIAWAVEDQIVAVRSLDGTTAESELSLAFTDAETHRVQVVVRDSNGRTAYDQLYVQPSAESFEPTGWSDVEPLDCSDSGYAARNSEECWDIEVPEETPEPEEESDDADIGPFEIRYDTDGYVNDWFAGMRNIDSSYLGTTSNSFGLAGGRYADWNRGILERTYDNTIRAGSRFLFGQEQETVTCEVRGGAVITSGCSKRVFELERTGGTTNAHSATRTGMYSEYGLEGGERVRGINPLELKEGETAEVTIIVQQHEDGVVDEVIEGVGSSADMVRGTVDEYIGDEEGSESEPDPKDVPSETGGEITNWRAAGSPDGHLVSGDADDATSPRDTDNVASSDSYTGGLDVPATSGESGSPLNPNLGGLVR